MATKTCPNGHRYDPSIYGDQCPLCPAQEGIGHGFQNPGAAPATQIGGNPVRPELKTQIGGAPMQPDAAAAHTQLAPPRPSQQPMQPPIVDNVPITEKPGVPTGHPANRTVIRHAPVQGRPPVRGVQGPTRKLVGFLITYNRDPNGKAYHLYEGRNYIGRDASCDISIPEDDQMSGKHLSILYRNVDDKFKFRDEQSSNGTFINKQLIDSGELENYDIIRAGSTIFIFLAIPKIS